MKISWMVGEIVAVCQGVAVFFEGVRRLRSSQGHWGMEHV
jgi:hypothetical protein